MYIGLPKFENQPTMKTQFLVLLCGVLSPILMAHTFAKAPVEHSVVIASSPASIVLDEAKPISFFRNDVVKVQVHNPLPTQSPNQLINSVEDPTKKSSTSEFSYKNMVLPATRADLNSIGPQKEKFDQGHLFAQGAFYGFIIMLALVNFFCFVLFKDKTFAFFAGAITTLIAFLFVGDGIGHLFFVENLYNELFQTTLMFVMISAQLLFAHHYLLAKEKAPKIKGFAWIVMTTSALAIIFLALSQNTVFGQIAKATMLLALARYLYLAIAQFSAKSYVKLYVIASALPFLVFVDQFILELLGDSLIGPGTGLLKFITIMQGLLLTYGIINRMQSLKTDRELRQLEMRIFVERQDALSARIKTEKLVEDMYLENLIMQYDLDAIEIKLLQYISEGKTNGSIARKLKTSIEDIEDRTKDLYQKLDIAEQVQKDIDWSAEQPDYLYN